jgi:hypothetical protein
MLIVSLSDLVMFSPPTWVTSASRASSIDTVSTKTLRIPGNKIATLSSSASLCTSVRLELFTATTLSLTVCVSINSRNVGAAIVRVSAIPVLWVNALAFLLAAVRVSDNSLASLSVTTLFFDLWTLSGSVIVIVSLNYLVNATPAIV